MKVPPVKKEVTLPIKDFLAFSCKSEPGKSVGLYWQHSAMSFECPRTLDLFLLKCFSYAWILQRLALEESVFPSLVSPINEKELDRVLKFVLSALSIGERSLASEDLLWSCIYSFLLRCVYFLSYSVFYFLKLYIYYLFFNGSHV